MDKFCIFVSAMINMNLQICLTLLPLRKKKQQNILMLINLKELKQVYFHAQKIRFRLTYLHQKQAPIFVGACFCV